MARSVEAIRVSERVKLREIDIGRCREREKRERRERKRGDETLVFAWSKPTRPLQVYVFFKSSYLK